MHSTTAAHQPMVLTINKLMLLLAVLIIGGCANAKYQQDYRPDTRFDNLQTYSWRQISSEIPGTDTNQLKTMADAHLSSQGLIHNSENPDLILDMTLVTRISTGSSTGIGLSVGLPIGQRGSIGLGGGKSLPNDKFEGVILLDITKSENNTLLWRGSADGIPMKTFELKNQAKLNTILGKLIQQFPPR